MKDKGIDLMLNNIMLEKTIIKLYPDLNINDMIKILNSLITTKRDLNIDDTRILFKKHIPKIYNLIDWKIYYEYCVINDYLERFEKETGLTGTDLLSKLSNNSIGWINMNSMMNYLQNSNYKHFITEFKKNFSKEMIEENSIDTHIQYVEREKKLKRILSFVNVEE